MIGSARMWVARLWTARYWMKVGADSVVVTLFPSKATVSDRAYSVLLMADDALNRAAVSDLVPAS